MIDMICRPPKKHDGAVATQLTQPTRKRRVSQNRAGALLKERLPQKEEKAVQPALYQTSDPALELTRDHFLFYGK